MTSDLDSPSKSEVRSPEVAKSPEATTLEQATSNSSRTRVLAESPTVTYTEDAEPRAMDPSTPVHRFSYDLRTSRAKAFSLEGAFVGESVDVKEQNSFMWFLFHDLEHKDGSQRDFWWQSEVTALDYVEPTILKRPEGRDIRKRPSGPEDPGDDNGDDGDDEGSLKKRPVAKKLKSNERKLIYSKEYHRVRANAIHKGATPEKAKDKAKKAAQKAVAHL